MTNQEIQDRIESLRGVNTIEDWYNRKPAHRPFVPNYAARRPAPVAQPKPVAPVAPMATAPAPKTTDPRWTFVTAGNAVFTLESKKTGVHFTYRARRSQDGRVTFLALLTGPDNTHDYSYLGVLDATTGAVRLTAKSCAKADAPSVIAATFFCKWAAQGTPTPNLVFHHEGRCGRCGRTLTTPESVERGIGPECAGKLGM